MRKLLVAAITFAISTIGAIGTAVAQYGPPPSVAPAATVPGGAGTGAGTGDPGGSGLAFTGTDLIGLLLRVGIVALALGGLALLLSRRRRFQTIDG